MISQRFEVIYVVLPLYCTENTNQPIRYDGHHDYYEIREAILLLVLSDPGDIRCK